LNRVIKAKKDTFVLSVHIIGRKKQISVLLGVIKIKGVIAIIA
jgi:hypothetical protein